MREGTFREDLLFRLNVVNLRLPAAARAAGDILDLADHFAKKYADANGVPLRPISAEARAGCCSANRWHGNVRELENTMHRAVLLAQGDEIGVDAILTPGRRAAWTSPGPRRRWRTPPSPPKQVTRALVGHTVADVERDLILDTLKHCLGNRTHAANILGISIRTLRNKLNEYADGGIADHAGGIGRLRADGGSGLGNSLHRRPRSVKNAARRLSDARQSRIAWRVGLPKNMNGIAGLQPVPGK